MRILPAFAGLALTGLTLAGCGSHPAGADRSSGPSVQIRGFAFAPATLTVKVGTKVTWTQDDATVHTVSDTGVFDSGTLPKGQTYSYTFGKAGTYHYLCTIHPYMKGTVIVQP